MPLLSFRDGLTINQAAQAYQNYGLAAERVGDYDFAYVHYQDAKRVLRSLPEPTTDAALQLARVTRDIGITEIGEAITQMVADDRQSSVRRLDHAYQMLREAAGINEHYESMVSDLCSESLWDGISPKTMLRAVCTEQGRTASIMARLVTLRTLIEGIDTRDDDYKSRGARLKAEEKYEGADSKLQFTGIDWVVNSLAAARQERLNGRSGRMVRWLGRAVLGVGWTILADTRNAPTAVRSMASGIWRLRSYEAARVSAFLLSRNDFDSRDTSWRELERQLRGQAFGLVEDEPIQEVMREQL